MEIGEKYRQVAAERPQLEFSEEGLTRAVAYGIELRVKAQKVEADILLTRLPSDELQAAYRNSQRLGQEATVVSRVLDLIAPLQGDHASWFEYFDEAAAEQSLADVDGSAGVPPTQ